MTQKSKLILTAAVVALLVIAAACWYLRARPSLPEKYQQATQSTVTKTKEVRQNADAVRATQKQHDQEITRRVEEARNSVPSDIDALIDLANAIISEATRGKPCVSDSNKDKR